MTRRHQSSGVPADRLSSEPGTRTTALRVIFAALVGFLLVFAFALSFGALRHRAIEAEIIHGALATVLWGGLSIHTQAGIWALCPDVLAVVGIIGIRLNRKDPRAWAALILGLGLTLTFQVWEDPWAPLLRAVPAVAGAMAVWMMEVPWGRFRPAWDPIPDPPQPQDPEPDQPEPDQTRPRVAQGGARARGRPAPRGRPRFTPVQMNQIRQWVTEERSVRFMAGELGLDDNQRNRWLAPVVRQLKVESNGGGGS